MSAIALVLRAMGHTVSGSDLKDSPVAERLRSHGITVAVGHRPENVAGADARHVLAGGAAGEPRAGRGARTRGSGSCPAPRCWPPSAPPGAAWPWRGRTGRRRRPPCCRLILVEAGLRPSFVIGADVNEIGTNAVWDSGEWLVVEADESYGTFRAIRPDLAVLTNVEPDHLDYYGTFEALRPAFSDFVAGAGGGSVVCADDPEAAAIGREHGAITVGRTRARPTSWPTSSCSAARCRSACAGPRGAGRAAHRRSRTPQRPERRGGRRGRAPGRCALRGGAGRAGPLRRRHPPLRVPRRVAWRDLRGRLRPPADRGAGRPGDGEERRLVPRGRGVPAPPLLAHRRPGDAVRDRVRRRRRPGGDRRLQRRRAARPRRLGPPGGRRRAGAGPETARAPTRRAGRSCARRSAPSFGRATCASPWGRAT